ncbi:Tannase/feruloyl esterase [Xylariaceae sp. FL0016]|nr:Tannase/feruloyl esterase [Xylariaceae sp. FL0016]
MYWGSYRQNLAITAAYLALITGATSASSPRQVGGGCSATTFANVLPANAKVERVDSVDAGSTYGEGPLDLLYPVQPTNLPELCAVTIRVTSSLVSAYRFAVFLPAEWNNKFLAVGNGGFGGGINWLDMGAGVQYGFSVVSTDTGHSSVSTDLKWALNNSETKTDWGWRAMHGSVTLGKLLTQAYYARPISYSYYSGCSTGGRQGLKEMQISPTSFDGVLVGSAAWYTSHLNNWVTRAATYNWPASDPKHIDTDLLTALAPQVVKQCDDIDGVADGIISLPEQCTLDYTALSCSKPGANGSACLTDARIQTMKDVYGDWVSSTGGVLYPGLTISSERQMYLVLNYSDASPYGINYARYFLYDDANFTLSDFNDSAVQLADKLDPGGATANKYNLSDFKNRGGKMVMYHGMADGLVPMKGSSLYYNNVMQTMGGNLTETQQFFRYFMVPGMQHCGLTVTDSPWAFGAPNQAGVLGNDTWSVPGFNDAEHDVLLALMDWVEHGVPVNQVIASTWKKPTNVSTGLLKQRPICPYPQMAKWDGKGDQDQASSWYCG